MPRRCHPGTGTRADNAESATAPRCPVERIDVTAPAAGVLHSQQRQGTSRFHWRVFTSLSFAFAAFLAVIALLQYRAGAYAAGLDGAPDEAAHYVTGLMVREYVLSGMKTSPLRFAEQYYISYPQVAIGHWPPVFYIVQACWMLVAGPSRTSVLLLIAVITASIAVVLFAAVQRISGTIAAVLTAILFLLLPLTQMLSGMVMAETLLALFTLISVLAWSRFLDTGRVLYAAVFGAAAFLAIMTKGNGWAIMLMPPITIVLGRRLDLLRSRILWITLAGVVLLCLPWQILTMRMVQNGWEYQPGVDFFRQSAITNARWMVQALGPIPGAVVIVGLLSAAWSERGSAVQALAHSVVAIILGTWLFHSVTPASIDKRHLFMALPAALLFLRRPE